MTSSKWRTIRCVVEVKVPPRNRSDEKDLIYNVERALGQAGKIHLPRLIHDDNYVAKPKVKSYVRVTQAERGRPPPQTVFEQLVIRGIYAILSLVMRGQGAARATGNLRNDLANFLGMG